MDLHHRVLDQIRGFDPVTDGPGIHAFSSLNMDLYPESNTLLLTTYSWLEEGKEARIQYYSADEPNPSTPAEPPSRPQTSKGKTKASPGGASTPQKRVTTAVLAEHLFRLNQMADRQSRVEGLLSAPPKEPAPPTPAQRQPGMTEARPSALTVPEYCGQPAQSSSPERVTDSTRPEGERARGRAAATSFSLDKSQLRAFSPLCPAEWAAIALSFVKEIDIIKALATETGGRRCVQEARFSQEAKTGKRRWRRGRFCSTLSLELDTPSTATYDIPCSESLASSCRDGGSLQEELHAPGD